MGMFEQFPYSNFHELNLDWIIEQIKNVLESAVISVNGQTGEVILYQSENVVFPDVESNQWRMVRTASGHTAGVMFNDDYMYVMYDNTADRVYTMNHPPQYPVTSVDGQTGAVRVFPDAGARLPDVTEDYTNIRRQIETNGTQNIVGIEVKQNKAYRMKDTGRYEIYDSDNPPPYPVTSVNGQTGVVMLAIPFTDVTVDDVMFINAVSGHEWGIGRETADGTATIQIITDATKAEAYIDFFDEDSQVSYTKKLLTTDDIPSSSGVVSINGQTGVVTIYGDTMPIESGSQNSIKDVTDGLGNRLTTAEGTITQHGNDIGTINNNIELIKSDIAIVENTNNATHNITAGQYVVWKGSLYTALSNIASGAGLSSVNLSAVSSGGLNDLYSQINTLNDNLEQIKPLYNDGNNWQHNVNVNSFKTPGVFGIGASPTNAPNEWNYFHLLVLASGTSFINQLAIGNDRNVQQRFTNNDGSTWSAWEQIGQKKITYTVTPTSNLFQNFEVYAISIGRIFIIDGAIRPASNISANTELAKIASLNILFRLHTSSIAGNLTDLGRLTCSTTGSFSCESTMKNDWYSFQMIGFLA